MTRSNELGPVELVVLSFPGTRVDASVTAALSDVVDGGYVTVLDLIYLSMDEAGEVRQIEVDESLTETGLDGVTVDPRGLVSDAPPPPPAPAPAAGGSDDLVARLQQLGQLHDSGVLSDEEFAAAKRQLLS
ncbi:SHOCT domain-containing protein [Nocardia cyriacigeorgica]|uniref:SHOCT domain-containing protein n=1 Tax=Nocardia cyriacigeorgica TaxID=135487 RepID=UPI001E57DCAB|nr:SHOCT domain-containing protein [Nocardia cyriacigeorgica]